MGACACQNTSGHAVVSAREVAAKAKLEKDQKAAAEKKAKYKKAKEAEHKKKTAEQKSKKAEKAAKYKAAKAKVEKDKKAAAAAARREKAAKESHAKASKFKSGRLVNGKCDCTGKATTGRACACQNTSGHAVVKKEKAAKAKLEKDQKA